MKFIAVGHICHDVAPNGYIIGGGTAYASMTARNLGAEAYAVTAVGPDFDADNPLLRGIQIVNVGSEATTVFENTYPPGGRVQRVRSAASSVMTAPDTGIWRDANVTYLCPIADEVPPGVIDCVSSGIIGAAPQGWLRTWGDDGLVRTKRWEHAERVLPRLDVLVLSEEDIASIPDELMRYRASAARVVLTRGRLGARLFEGERTTDYAAYAATEVDPTGAGDVFAAALLCHMSRSGDIGESIDFANCAASFTVEAVGTAGVPTSEQVERRWRKRGRIADAK